MAIVSFTSGDLSAAGLEEGIFYPGLQLAQTSTTEDDDLIDDDDLIGDEEEDEEEEVEDDDAATDASAAHEALFAESRYPSAGTCGTCHPKHYREWRVSQHSYAQLSPVYLSLNNRINELANGSNGDFCLRCHNQVGANLGENSFVSNLERHPTSREGITCVVCHRINKSYNKASGRLALVEGGLTDPIFGPKGNEELARVLDNTQARISQVSSIFSATRRRFCYKNHEVVAYMERRIWHTRWVNRNRGAFGSFLTVD